MAVAARHGQVSKHSHPAGVLVIRRRAEGVLRLQVIDSAVMQHVWLLSLLAYETRRRRRFASVLRAASPLSIMTKSALAAGVKP